jgi:hypothetical protein
LLEVLCHRMSLVAVQVCASEALEGGDQGFGNGLHDDFSLARMWGVAWNSPKGLLPGRCGSWLNGQSETTDPCSLRLYLFR